MTQTIIVFTPTKGSDKDVQSGAGPGTVLRGRKSDGARALCLVKREPAGQPTSGGTSNGADRSRSEAERAQREKPRDEASGRSDAGSDDTGTWFERRLREPFFVIPEIADCQRQRGTAREREGAFGNAVITAEVRYSLLTKHYPGRAVATTAPDGTADACRNA